MFSRCCFCTSMHEVKPCQYSCWPQGSPWRRSAQQDGLIFVPLYLSWLQHVAHGLLPYYVSVQNCDR